jgi:hypothetical protein
MANTSVLDSCWYPGRPQSGRPAMVAGWERDPGRRLSGPPPGREAARTGSRLG